jgi:hypothetical protein
MNAQEQYLRKLDAMDAEDREFKAAIAADKRRKKARKKRRAKTVTYKGVKARLIKDGFTCCMTGPLGPLGI